MPASPRILIDAGSGRRPDQMASSVTIMPYMLDPGEAHIIAEAMHAALTNPGHHPDPVVPSGAPAMIDGTWAVTRPVYARAGRAEIHHPPGSAAR